MSDDPVTTGGVFGECRSELVNGAIVVVQADELVGFSVDLLRVLGVDLEPLTEFTVGEVNPATYQLLAPHPLHPWWAAGLVKWDRP